MERCAAGGGLKARPLTKASRAALEVRGTDPAPARPGPRRADRLANLPVLEGREHLEPGSLPGLNAATVPVHVRVPQIASPQGGVEGEPAPRVEAEEDDGARLVAAGHPGEEVAQAIANLCVALVALCVDARATNPVGAGKRVVSLALERV